MLLVDQFDAYFMTDFNGTLKRAYTLYEYFISFGKIIYSIIISKTVSCMYIRCGWETRQSTIKFILNSF